MAKNQETIMSGSDSKVKIVRGRGLPLPGADLDTDRVIPARFMKCVTFEDLGQYAFYDARFNADGSKKDHPMNEKKYEGATILIVGRNFGCGSSREHAPQSLMKYGFQAIIGETFAEIFAGNCTAIGLPTATAESSDIENLMAFVKDDPACEISLNLETKELSYGDFSFPLKIQDQSRIAFLEGTWDTTGTLVGASEQIKKVANSLPYLSGFKN